MCVCVCVCVCFYFYYNILGGEEGGGGISSIFGSSLPWTSTSAVKDWVDYSRWMDDTRIGAGFGMSLMCITKHITHCLPVGTSAHCKIIKY